MNDATTSVFPYALHPHERRHGPQGYEDYQSYKPWLRDEFSFRCVYCLCRESWFPDGDDSFSVDHFAPRTEAPERTTDYDNLVYACCQCNRLKQGATGLLNPCAEALAEHLVVRDDGTIFGKTPEGVEFIRVCGLDRPSLSTFRRGILELWRLLRERKSPQAAELRRQIFGLPSNLPCLALLRPPGGNRRPNGLAESYFERQRRGEASET
jgi:hypothetical protein